MGKKNTPFIANLYQIHGKSLVLGKVLIAYTHIRKNIIVIRRWNFALAHLCPNNLRVRFVWSTIWQVTREHSRGGGGGDEKQLLKTVVCRESYLDANLFFSFRERGRAVRGSSLTGVRSLITLLSLRNSFPIWSSFRGLGVRSSTSVRRDFFSVYFPEKEKQKVMYVIGV